MTIRTTRENKMKLYYYDTLNPRKACAVARYLNSPVEFVHTDMRKGEHKTPEFLAINPNGKVPALVDGNLKLWESNAIMCHLARKAGSDLWPQDDARKVELTRWLTWNSEHFTRHAGELYFQYIIKPKFGLGAQDEKAIEDATGFWRRFAGVLNDHLRGRKFILDTLTVADFAIGITLPYAETAKIPVGEFPEIERWHARMSELPGWRDPWPADKAAAA
jgi:glutathione S-transferase